MDVNVFLGALSIVKTTNPVSLFQFIQTTGYSIMLILMIVEGPIVTYVAAFAASLDIFNIYYVFILSFLGNIIGDLVVFGIGRMGKKVFIDKYVHKLLREGRIKKIKDYLEKNPGRTIAAIKLTPTLPVPGIILAGASDIPLKKFVFYSALLSLAYSVLMTFLGFYSGVAFDSISKYVKYIEYIIGGAILLAVIVYFLMRLISQKIANKIEKI
ncbi:MAG: DedA family protein [Nanoarchaeota archaeon]